MGGITGKEKAEHEKVSETHVPKAPEPRPAPAPKSLDKSKDGEHYPRQSAHRSEMDPQRAQAGPGARSGETKHFIRSELRPDLTQGALCEEPDVQ
jgi:hypothetical protein